MDLGLSGKRALVLSSSRGLGLGIASGLAAEGACVVLTGRDRAKLDAETATINGRKQGKVFAVVADLGTAEGRAAITKAVEADLGGLDVLVNNTGGPPPKAAADVSADDWRAQIETMLIPVTEITRHFLPAMRAQKWGRVITVASSGIIQPLGNLAISNALRSAILGWSKTLSAEVARDAVTVNVIVPGRIHTDRIDQLDEAAAKRAGKTAAEIATASRASIAMGRYGKVEEFAAVGVFLASAQAAFVTGSVVRVDGGMVLSV